MLTQRFCFVVFTQLTRCSNFSAILLFSQLILFCCSTCRDIILGKTAEPYQLFNCHCKLEKLIEQRISDRSCVGANFTMTVYDICGLETFGYANNVACSVKSFKLLYGNGINFCYCIRVQVTPKQNFLQ